MTTQRRPAPRSGPAPLPAAGTLATGVLVVATVLIITASPDTPVSGTWGFRGFAAVLAVAFGSVGALITARVHDNRIGPLLVGIGMWAAVVAFCVEYAAYGLVVAPGSLPGAVVVGWLVSWVWVPFAGLATTFLLLLFPDGHLASPRWGPVAWLAASAMVALSAGLAMQPGPIQNAPFLANPMGAPDEWSGVIGALTTVGFVLLASSVVLSTASMVVRYRHTTGVARQQMKWFAAAAVFAGLTLAGPGTLFNIVVSGDPATSRIKLFEILTIAAFLMIPIATGIAVLRYHLYEIDRIISRTLGWTIVTGLLVAVFAVAVVALQALLAGFTQGQTLAVAASTLVAFALFQPVRRRVQRTVDRRFDRARYDAERTAVAFAERLRDETDIEAVAGDLSTTTRAALAPASLAIWLRRP